MRRAIAIVFFMIMVVLPVVAGTQSGSTFGTLTDNSLVFKGYYQGPVETNPTTDSNITLEFKDYTETVLNHAAQQGTSGTVVTAVNNRHVGENTGTIFSWSMKGTTTSIVHLNFSFSTMQAEVNGQYFVPAYTVVMTQNVTKKVTRVVKTLYSNGNLVSDNTNEENYGNDSFYSNSTKNITNIAERPTNPASSEVLTVYSDGYSGKVSDTDGTAWGSSSSNNQEKVSGYNQKQWVTTTTTIAWYRSGTCTLNIKDYEQERPGTYRYVCWVITELLIE